MRAITYCSGNKTAGLSRDPNIYDLLRDPTTLKTQTAHDSGRPPELKNT